jgi:ceramide glucosyltransferase
MIDLMALLAAGLAGTLGSAHLGTALLALPGVRRRVARQLTATPRPAAAPAAVTLLRPACGLDAHDAETLATSFVQDHPDYEVIFCVADADDPAVAVIGELIAAHPHVDARLLIGNDRISNNPKLNNLQKGWVAARHDVICMADSNLLLPPGYLREVVTLLDTPGTGLVSSPPSGGRPEGWAAHLECAFLNANQVRLQLAADTLGLGFAQGKTLACRRALIDSAGGLAALGRKMAEDVNATLLVREAGLRVRLTPDPFVQPLGRRRLADVWSRQMRWSIVRRDGFPWLFQMEFANGALVGTLALAGALGLTGLSMAWLWPWLAAWYGAEVAVARRRGWPMGWRDLAMLPVRDAMLPLIWMATLRRQHFEWRGNVLRPGAADARPGNLAHE